MSDRNFDSKYLRKSSYYKIDIFKNKISILFNGLNRDVSMLIISFIGIWVFISESVELTYEIVNKFSNKLIWGIILNKWIKNNNDNNKICDKYITFIKKSERLIFNNEKCVNTINLNSNYFYSENFIDCFPNKVHWAWIIVNIKLPIYLIDRYFNIIISV